jgi:hypothetical protein
VQIKVTCALSPALILERINNAPFFRNFYRSAGMLWKPSENFANCGRMLGNTSSGLALAVFIKANKCRTAKKYNKLFFITISSSFAYMGYELAIIFVFTHMLCNEYVTAGIKKSFGFVVS